MIFRSYTGNAMLNAALMTIEAMAQLPDVSAITPRLLLQLYKDHRLPEVNVRLKNYTMLFTNNGPLYNNGLAAYDALFREIIASFENTGVHTCEISGLRFNKTFEEIYEAALHTAGITAKEIAARDLTINRVWFPLIGSLGSDAQALPQAKFMIRIHPICIAILQFLPLSSLLYKGGVLLADSSDFDLARKYVKENYEVLREHRQRISVTETIPNISFAKGHYLLKALEILSGRESGATACSDLNLWSFTNSGTGASCEIDRVPGSLLRKLYRLNAPDTREDLHQILKDSFTAFSFLEELEGNNEWNLLYPNMHGVGQKKRKHEGYSVAFFDAYMTIIGQAEILPYARYIAWLIQKYKSRTFDKYLKDTSAWKDKDYRADLQAVLIAATANREWSFAHQLHVIDEKEQLPVKNSLFKLHKRIHFYYQKREFNAVLPAVQPSVFPIKNVCEWLIALIQQDRQANTISKDFRDGQKYIAVSYTELLLRAHALDAVDMKSIFYACYDERYIFLRIGINEMLRFFFNQQEQPAIAPHQLSIPGTWKMPAATASWLNEIQEFATNYQEYFYDKYCHKETGQLPHEKYLRTVEAISSEGNKFLYWFREALENVNDFLEAGGREACWSDALLHNPDDAFSLSFVKFTLKLHLLKLYKYSRSHQLTTIS